jgi:hypothetical protein
MNKESKVLTKEEVTQRLNEIFAETAMKLTKEQLLERAS